MRSSKSYLNSLAGLLLISASVTAQVDRVGTVKFPDHPRILLLKGEEQAIKKTVASDKTWAKLHQGILAECDVLLKVPPVERIQIGRRLLDKSREALRRLFLLSYAYRMTQQEAYLQRAEKELLAISAFSDWNPSHFLDVAEMTMAAAIGYDWLYTGLSEKSRSIIREAILKKGLEPSLNPKFNGWLKASNNWNQVCNAGMTYGALAIQEDQPELAKRLINRAIESIVLPMEDYSPGGAYPEGYGYWGYGTSFNVMFISAIEKVFGTDFGLIAQPGFLQTAGYLQHMTGPSGNSFNYSDAGSGGGLQPAMFWFASRLKDPSLLWVERSRLASSDASKHVKNRLLPAIMSWGGGMGINNILAPKSTMWVGAGKSPVALMRTSWTDPAAIYVGLKAGSPSVNHAHMDVGSFIMEADGVRWAMDFGMQEYESLESKGVQLFGRTQDAQRWEVFRYSNRVHNTLTVNDELQKVDGNAPLTGSSDKPLFMNATTDISSLYKGSLAKANRGIAVLDKAYVVVRDEVETLSKETTVRWTLLTPAEVKITGENRVELTKNGKKLIIQVQEPAKITMKTWSTDPPRDYDAPNPGTSLVGFEVKMPPNTKGTITVLLIPEGAEKKGAANVQPLSQWPR
ncbi:MAG: heparinase II/III family protein [Cytophagaceae bacterium]|nr:heparinase II/III family protein [Cytophagaceae bacterium]